MTLAMPLVSARVRSRFPDSGADLNLLDGNCCEYESIFNVRFVPERDPGGDLALSVRDKARLLVMSMTSHARTLTWSLIESINHDSAAAAVLVARAHVEVTGLMGYLLVRLRKHRDGQLSEQDFHDVVVRLYLATRKHPPGTAAALAEKTTAVNLVTLVDAIAKLSDLKVTDGQFRDIWEDLSEFCHPNMFSRLITGERLVDREIHFDLRPTIKEDSLSLVLNSSAMSQEVFFFCRQEAIPLIEQLAGDR